MIRLVILLVVGVLGSAEDWRGVEFTQVHFDAVTRLAGDKMLDPPTAGSARSQQAWRRAAELALWSLEPSVELLPQAYVDQLRAAAKALPPDDALPALDCSGLAPLGLRLSRAALAQGDPPALQAAWQRWLGDRAFGQAEFLCVMQWLEGQLPKGETRRAAWWLAWVNAASAWLKALDVHADVIAARFWEAESEAEHVAARADVGLSVAACSDAPPGAPWRCCVADVRRDSAAWAQDVRVGDRLGPLTDGRDPCGQPQALLGDEGESLALQLWSRRSRQQRTLSLRRDRAVSRDVEAHPLGSASVHLQLRDFVRGTAERTRLALAAALPARRGKAAQPRGVILDLRGNRGGVLDESVAVADWLLQHGAIVQTRWRERTEVRQAFAGPGELRVPVVVLLDRRCGSACEVLAGALQDQRRAPLLGMRSYGKASMQKVHKVNQMWGFYVKYTIGKYLTPAGHDLDGRGLQPDVALPADATSAFDLAAHSPWQQAQQCVRARGSAAKRLAAMDAPRQKPDPWLEMAIDWLDCLAKRSKVTNSAGRDALRPVDGRTAG